MGVIGAIVFIVIAIVTVKIISEKINSKADETLAGDDTPGYSLVDSTEIGEDGKSIKVPVPDGFTASQVPGETTVNGGFVIYEGEVDWSKIEDLDSYAEVATQAEETNTSSENASSAENTNSEDTNGDSTNTEGSSAGEENSNIDDGSNTESNTNSNGEEESANSAENNTDGEEEQTEEKSADVPEETEQESAQGENIATGEEYTQKEGTSASENGENGNNGDGESQTGGNEEIEKTEVEEEQAKNEIINEEEAISNEEAGIATMSEDDTDADEGIKTLAEGETPTTVFELQTSRNQYVWVPVKDVSRIYGIDSKGKLWGKLYSGVSKTATARQSRDWSESNGIMNIKDKTGYREPDVVAYLRNTNMNYRYDKDSELQNYRDGIEQYQMLSQEMEESYYKMIESVKKYGGFYIGRYETGDLNQEKAVVKKMNTDINYATWYEMYELCKEQEGEKENIETGMIWGSLWDETLQWLLETGAQIQNGEGGTREITESDINSNSSDWGNYYNVTFEYTNTNGGTSTKNESSSTRIPTGSTEYTKANNIYDLAGNMCDWTLEANSTYNRVLRGGSCGNGGSSGPGRGRRYSYPTYSVDDYGCRSALYIK